MITQEEANRIFNYDPETGIFTYKISTCNCVKAGAIAGSPSHGYLTVMYKGRNYKLHRLVFLLESGMFPEEQVDHINGVRSDNRRCNLRLASNAQNCQNKSAKGVIFYRNRYVAYAYHNNKSYYLGRYESFEEAKKVSEEKRKELKGEFYREDSMQRSLE